jgi:hypothetical protein
MAAKVWALLANVGRQGERRGCHHEPFSEDVLPAIGEVFVKAVLFE